MKHDYGGWLFMYTIVAISSFASFMLMMLSCKNLTDLALWAWCVMIGTLLLGIFCIYSAYKLTHKDP